MIRKNQYDEKQMYDRGKAFQAGFFSAILTIFVVFLMTDMLGISIDSYAVFLITLWIPMTSCFIMLIVKDAYDGVNSSAGKFVLSIYGMSGFITLSLTLINISIGKENFFSSGYITDSVGHIFSGTCMVATSIVYWVKQRVNRNKYCDE